MKLQASNQAHPASYYNKSSSHYQGGAHNVILSLAADSMKTQKSVAQPARTNLGNHGHNAILEMAQSSINPQATPKVQANSIPSQKSMGGSHNVAMAVLTESSNKFKKQQQHALKNNHSPFSMFSASNANVSDKQYQKNLQ